MGPTPPGKYDILIFCKPNMYVSYIVEDECLTLEAFKFVENFSNQVSSDMKLVVPLTASIEIVLQKISCQHKTILFKCLI